MMAIQKAFSGRRQSNGRLVWFIVLTAACMTLVNGHDPVGSSRFHRSKYPSILDDLVKRYNELKDFIDTEPLSEDMGFVQGLLSEGKRRSLSMIEGVRNGAESSSLDIESSLSRLKSSTPVDMIARSFSIKLAWVVVVQASFTALFSHRQRLFEVAARLVKSDTIAAVRTIQTILESVDNHGVIDVFKKYPLQDSVASIYALSRLQAATEFYYKSQTGSKSGGSHTPAVEDFPILQDEGLLEELNHYAPYASATYGWKLDLATAGRLHRGDLHALTRITQIRPEDVVMVEWESRPHRPAFYIVRDRKRKRIVLAIRGTWSAHDILTDLCCTSEEYFVRSSGQKHRAHNGMLAAARGVMSLAEEIIEQELESHPEYSVVLVGHSLGGSVAAVLGQMWADTFRGIRVYAYGPACVAPMDDISRKIVVSVLLEGDPFSSLSLGHVADTSFAVSYLCEDEDLRTKILVVTDGPLEIMDKGDVRWCKERMEEIREQMTGAKLYPPGRLLFVGSSENRRGRSVIREVPSSFYGELRIGTRMFDLRRHVPRVYQRRLTSALRSFEQPHRAT